MAKSENNNPYVGPRAFTPDDKSLGRGFYGREREVEELTDLLLSDRIVLLYAPSGAGKTSLINAELIPRLRDEEMFDVLPTVTLRRPPAEPLRDWPEGTPNRYVYSTLLSLGDGLPDGRRPAAPATSTMLAEYLGQIVPIPCGESAPDEFRPQFLVFDQFEEVLTLNPIDQEAKHEFFSQLGEALRNRSRWALFAMREDYVAALDPFLYRIHTRLRSTFRLDFLTKEKAGAAIQLPAKNAGVSFYGEAVKTLVDELSKVRVQKLDGGFDEPRSGPYVEPVQLQVVCWQIWEKLPLGAKQIGRGELKDDQFQRIVTDVDEALANYYADKVKEAAAAVEGVSERVVRIWVENLMSDKGIRLPVLREEGATRGLDNRAIDVLVAAHLVRPDERGGRALYELAHDRLIEPIRKSNSHWLEANLSQSWSLSKDEMIEYHPVEKGNRRGVALCLGGGGLRAAVFHLGALTRLNELGVLSQVRTISAAGGGSVLAAFLMRQLNPWPEQGHVMEETEWMAKVVEPFRAFAVRGLRWLAPSEFFWPFQWFLGVGAERGIKRLRAYFERDLISLPLSRMPERPSFVFGATDAVFAARWTFEKARMGDYQAGYVSPPPEMWTVARAVTASFAAQPLFGTTRCRFRPNQLTGGKYDGEDRDKLVSELRLLNGLHYDHLAVEPVWRNHEVVLVSDGGSRVQPNAKGLNFLQDIVRYMDISYAQNDALRKGWLLSNFASSILQGTYWSVTRNVREYEPNTALGYTEYFVERYLSSLRGDVLPIEPDELGVLENHGYLMADVGMRRRDARFFKTRRTGLTIPFPHLLDEKRAAGVFDK